MTQLQCSKPVVLKLVGHDPADKEALVFGPKGDRVVQHNPKDCDATGDIRRVTYLSQHQLPGQGYEESYKHLHSSRQASERLKIAGFGLHLG